MYDDSSLGRLPQWRPEAFHRIFEALQHPFYIVDARDYTLVLANAPVAELGEVHVGNTTCYQLTHNRSEPCAGEHPCPLEEIRRTGQGTRMEHIHYDAWGQPFPVEVHGEPLFDEAGQLTHMIEYSLDLTERRAIEEELRLASQVFHHTHEGIMVTDTEGRLERINEAFTSLTGYPAAEALGRRPEDFLFADWPEQDCLGAMWDTLQAEGHWEGEVWNRHQSGQAFPQWLVMSAVPDEAGAVRRFIGVFHDITERKEAEERLRRMAYHDPLTGLANRASLEDHLETTLRQVRRRGSSLALLYLDVDGFKGINDHYGHAVGDQVLQDVARSLEDQLRGTDACIARVGGDEFLVLAEEAEETAGVALARSLLGAFEQPFPLPDGGKAALGLSIGIRVVAADEADAGDLQGLIKEADDAMYAAKARDRSSYHLAGH
jgi:diguanylate cyclase (GGDEF)-like protein/PAS domain S-box-containing protein